MKQLKSIVAIMLVALCASTSHANTPAPTAIPGVQAVDWNNDGTLAQHGATAVFLDTAHGLLWSNTTIDMGTVRTFEEAVGLLASYNASGSIEGVTNWVLPTEAQFKLLYATQGPDTVGIKGMEKRVFDNLSTYVWTNTLGDLGPLSHKAFAANSLLNATDEFKTYGNATKMAVWAVAAVPEPETYAMLISGLGLIVVVARRRKVRQAP